MSRRREKASRGQTATRGSGGGGVGRIVNAQFLVKKALLKRRIALHRNDPSKRASDVFWEKKTGSIL